MGVHFRCRLILVRAYETEHLDACLRSFGKPLLLIVDEFGYRPVPASVAHLLFQVSAERYERRSVLITSNQAIGDWGNTLRDEVMATVVLVRVLLHCQVISIRGESYRLHEKRCSGLVEPRSLWWELSHWIDSGRQFCCRLWHQCWCRLTWAVESTSKATESPKSKLNRRSEGRITRQIRSGLELDV